jgi:hypothetical protein
VTIPSVGLRVAQSPIVSDAIQEERMAFSIGLRVYKVSIQKEKQKEVVPLGKDGPASDLLAFLKAFVASNTNSNDHDGLQRSWFFDEKPNPSPIKIHGFIGYGTFGFESNLLDRKTKKNNYNRKTDDLEEIPLYFQFWVPTTEDFGFLAFQSFQARSCVSLVTSAMQLAFSTKFKGYRLSIRKLMPEDVKTSAFFSWPVKQITLVKKNIPKNKEDKYLFDLDPTIAEYEVTLRAKRRRDLGSLMSFLDKAGDTKGVLEYDGVQFDEAKAEIAVGKKRRIVGVMGYNSDAGAIDITDSVVAPNGHPTLASIAKEADDIIKDFFEVLSTAKKK